MADAQAPPTFKLVLVGDGGTGKVRFANSRQLALAAAVLRHVPSDCPSKPLRPVSLTLYACRPPSSSAT